MNEQGMRDSTAPTTDTLDELTEYINGLVERDHDYGTCVYAMSLAATAAFNYVAHKLGVTGFQASCADLDILRRTRRMEGPFLLLNGADLLYPQYDLRGRLEEFMGSEEVRKWLAEEAAKLIAEGQGVESVRDHWTGLVSSSPSSNHANDSKVAE